MTSQAGATAPLRTDTQVVRGEQNLTAVVLQLIKISQWFQVEPYPDDAWHITVKAENSARLSRLIESEAVY